MSDNELIAQFDGWVFDEQKFPNNGRVKWWHPEKTKPILGDTVLPVSVDRFRRYQESWDWLMPVVEKIRDLDSGRFDFEISIAFGCRIIDYKLDESLVIDLSREGGSAIDAVYGTVVEFIKWYNESKKENV